jgi:hypothetical protein
MAALNRIDAVQPVEQLRVAQNLTYNWRYDATRKQLMRLYENAKRDQWECGDRDLRHEPVEEADPQRGGEASL